MNFFWGLKREKVFIPMKTHWKRVWKRNTEDAYENGTENKAVETYRCNLKQLLRSWDAPTAIAPAGDFLSGCWKHMVLLHVFLDHHLMQRHFVTHSVFCSDLDFWDFLVLVWFGFGCWNHMFWMLRPCEEMLRAQNQKSKSKQNKILKIQIKTKHDMDKKSVAWLWCVLAHEGESLKNVGHIDKTYPCFLRTIRKMAIWWLFTSLHWNRHWKRTGNAMKTTTWSDFFCSSSPPSDSHAFMKQ